MSCNHTHCHLDVTQLAQSPLRCVFVCRYVRVGVVWLKEKHTRGKDTGLWKNGQKGN